MSIKNGLKHTIVKQQLVMQPYNCALVFLISAKAS